MGHTDWLAQTKFTPPRLRDDFVPRKRLLDALYAAISTHPLTLISAPAGYGKTTLLASLPVAFPNLPLAWISLDEEDNDPARFLIALVSALQRLDPDFGVSIRTLLASLSNPAEETRRVMSALINETLERLTETWIVLDDLHLITEPAVYAALDYLLERMPPQLHLIVATRHDPPLALARLRGRGQLAELRVPDLRFTTDEASRFLNEKQCLDLSPEDLANLQGRAEGWAAGLRLLAGSLDQIDSAKDRAAFIHNLTLTERYVFDFLAEEVLKRQEPDTRTFLLETSILSEVTPALCTAVTGRRNAQAILDGLYRRNLFLVQVDETGKTFRYHALFAEFLREQLECEMPERIGELHQRAAEAQITSAPARAIAHYLSAGLWDSAAHSIEQVSDEFIRQGLFQTLHNWIDLLPETLRDAHPRLLYLLGLGTVQRGELSTGMAWLEKALSGFEACGDKASQGETLLAMVDTASLQQDYIRQAALAQQALAFPLPVHGQVGLLMAQVWQSVYQGNSDQTVEHLDKALDLALSANDARTYNVIAPLLNMHLAFLPDGIARLDGYCRQVLARFGDQVGLLQACTHSTLCFVRFYAGYPEDALREAERAQSITRLIGNYPFPEGQVHYITGMCLAMRGNHAGTEAYWSELLSWVEQTPAMQRYLVAIYYFIGRAQWIQHKYDQARQAERRMAVIAKDGELPEVALSRQVMRALLDISAGSYAAAEGALLQALPIEQRWAHARFFGSASVLLAYLYLQLKREKEALTLFSSYLAECERRGMPGLILQETAIAVPLLRLAIERKSHAEFAKSLLNVLDISDDIEAITIPETGQTLTRREIEVLKLIAEGASNHAIAQQLVISEHTVKVHITRILAKLNVASRTQAAARARDLIPLK